MRQPNRPLEHDFRSMLGRAMLAGTLFVVPADLLWIDPAAIGRPLAGSRRQVWAVAARMLAAGFETLAHGARGGRSIGGASGAVSIEPRAPST